MDNNGDLKTSIESIQTEMVSTNGNGVPKENSTKSTLITNKIPENNIQTVNCYW